jgi:hypothetical protein
LIDNPPGQMDESHGLVPRGAFPLDLLTPLVGLRDGAPNLGAWPAPPEDLSRDGAAECTPELGSDCVVHDRGLQLRRLDGTKVLFDLLANSAGLLPDCMERVVGHGLMPDPEVALTVSCPVPGSPEVQPQAVPCQARLSPQLPQSHERFPASVENQAVFR